MTKDKLYYLLFDPTDEIIVGSKSIAEENEHIEVVGECIKRTVEEFKSYVTPYAWVLLKHSDRDIQNMISIAKKVEVPKVVAKRSVSEIIAERKQLKRVTAYTDGSANANTRLGGIGVLIMMEHNGKTYESRISKGYSNTSIGRMELTAVYTALNEIKPSMRATTQVHIFSDSMYAVNCIKKGWLWKWAKDYGGLQIRTNGDILQKLIDIHDTYPKGNIIINHVKGHSTSEGNIEADRLAGNGYRSGDYEVDLK